MAKPSRRAGRSRRSQEIEQLLGEIDLRQKLADERREEAHARSQAELAVMHKDIAQVGKQIGELTGAWGRFSEDLLAPSILAAVQGMGIQIRGVERRWRAWRGDEVVKETDAVVHGLHGTPERPVCLVVSIKARARPEHVDRLVTDLDRFHDFYPTTRAAELLGALAAVGIDDAVRERAARKGLYVIQTGKNVAEVVNPRGFEPRVWSAAI